MLEETPYEKTPSNVAEYVNILKEDFTSDLQGTTKWVSDYLSHNEEC